MELVQTIQNAPRAYAQNNERRGLPSASTLWLVARCPGSWSLGQQVEFVPSPAMLDGTELHALIEAKLRGQAREQEPRARDELTAEQRAQRELLIAQKAEEAVQALKKVLDRNRMAMGETVWAIEQRYWIRWNGKSIGSAKPDYIGYDPSNGRLLVVDFKSISQPRTSMLDDIGENADHSIQMWAAVAAWISDALKGDYSKVEQVKLCYIKVPLWDKDAELTVQESEWRDHYTTLLQCHSVVALCLAALDNEPAFIPGAHCKWCRANKICNRRMLPVLIGMSPHAAKSAMRLEPALAALVMAYKSELEALIEGAKEILLSLTSAQLERYGWRRALPTRKDQITNAVAAFQLLRDAGVPENTLLEACSISANALAESIAVQRGISVGEAKDWLKNILGQNLETVESGPRLVRVKGAIKPSLEPEPLEEI